MRQNFNNHFWTNLYCKYDCVTQVNIVSKITIKPLSWRYSTNSFSFFSASVSTVCLIFIVAARSEYISAFCSQIYSVYIHFLQSKQRLRGLCNKAVTRGRILVSSMVLESENNPNNLSIVIQFNIYLP